MLKEIPVSYRTKTYNSVCKLMKEAFPENERMPVWILQLLATRKCVRFHAITDCDTFYIDVERKEEYYNALEIADEKNDFNALYEYVSNY